MTAWVTRPEGAVDAGAVREINRVAFGRPDEADLVEALRSDVAGIRLSIEVPDEALLALSLDGTPLPLGLVRYAPPFGI